MVNPFQAALGLLLVFVLPGYFLVKALFGKARLSADFHGVTVAFLSIVMSVVVTILVGSGLGFLPKPAAWEKGWFQGAATGAPILEIALAGVTLLFAAVALARGAFPRVTRGLSKSAAADSAEAPSLDAALDAASARARAWKARREGRRADAEREDALAERAIAEASRREYGR